MKQRRPAIIKTARVVSAFFLIFILWRVVRPPIDPALPPLVIDDVTQMNPISVASVVVPRTTDDIVNAVRNSPGPISIGGARHSMGGQIGAPGSLHLDMRHFDKVLAFSRERKTITVQTGITWRSVQEYVDRFDLSVSIMQTYANFTVGGSLSVNGHGRYVGKGPIISSVISIKVVLADGTIVDASPTVNTGLFDGAIGGYGGLGVIAEATLALADNVRVARHDVTMPVTTYEKYFDENIRNSTTAIFHNGDIYPPQYETIRAVTYDTTDESLTTPDRLISSTDSYGLNRFAYWVVSEWPLGLGIREYVIDPILFSRRSVTWRNYEASYDTAELEPASRASSSYVLEEYFVPLDGFDEFTSRMRSILRQHDVNVINVSVRQATRDPGSLLAWARTDVFSFVIYYKQGTSTEDRNEVGVWTRELVDAASELGGSYYLPYQLHATKAQFLRAYPRAGEFFDLKRRVDPTNKFRNELWIKYAPS